MMTFEGIDEKDVAAEELSRPGADIASLLQRPGVDAHFLLYEASKRNSIARMDELVRAWGADANAAVDAKASLNFPTHRAPPLFGAVDGSAVSAVEWLLARGADPNAPCLFEEEAVITPLWTAAENGNAHIGKMLLDRGADVDAAKSTTGNTPLFIAVQNRHQCMISLLLDYGADPDKCQQPSIPNSWTPLEVAIGFGHPRIVAQLTNAGAEVSVGAMILLQRIKETKTSVDQFQRGVSDDEVKQITELLQTRPYLEKIPAYTRAKTFERTGRYGKALEILRLLNCRAACTQIKLDIDRLVEAIYGVRGSDCTISIWDRAPLMTQTEPTPYTDYAQSQLGRCIYRHGGVDKERAVEQRDELWEFDVDAREWRLLPVEGKTPGPRTGHAMWAWEGALYIWGGKIAGSRRFDTKLYRLRVKGPLMWEIVKTKMTPPGRECHAGVLYKGKYYISGGDLLVCGYCVTNEAWCLNMRNCKWARLPDSPIERYCHGMWAANDRLYLLGGRGIYYNLLATRPQHAGHSIERFVSYDLTSKVWSDEPVIGDSPHDISEFSILPVYDSENEDDPSSIIVWGGYHEFDRRDASELKSKEVLQAMYGDDWSDFHCQYVARLLRFYPDTGVWKNLKPTSSLLPKAQSFAAMVRAGDSSLELLIGGGYGFNAHSMETRSESALGEECATPEISNAGNMHNAKRCAALDIFDGKSWAWDLFRLSGDSMPHYLVDFSPSSPILYNAVDYTHEDFKEPPCAEVKPNDEDTLLGVRVEICGLGEQYDGKIGRIGCWLEEEECYQVFLHGYRKKGLGMMAARPANLIIADRVDFLKMHDIEALAKSGRRKYPTVYMGASFKYDPTAPRVKRYLFDQIIDPLAPNGTHAMQVYDIYNGPVSRRAQAIMRAVSLPIELMPKQFAEESVLKLHPQTLVCKLAPGHRATNPSGEEVLKRQSVYSDFVRKLKERDTCRVREFERKVAEVSDSDVSAKCGKWLRVKVSVDGMVPTISCEILVNPDISMSSLHNHVLCPCLGWKSYNHAYAFRRSGMVYRPLFGVDEVVNQIQVKEKHKRAMKAMDDEVWIGPKRTSACDTMFLPLYVGGCMANDKEILLGQLFSLDDNGGEMCLQWVSDLGDWWSHSISVTRYDEDEEGKVPTEASVAHLVRGTGGCIPEDIGGVRLYFELILQLTGRIPIPKDDHKGSKSAISPCSEEWWSLFNTNWRGKANRMNFLSNPFEFDMERVRAKLDTEIRRPKPRHGWEGAGMRKWDMSSGLHYEMHQKCTISRPKKSTDVCAYCGATVALKLCSACSTVAYCSRDHAVANWTNHKSDCKKARKRRSKK